MADTSKQLRSTMLVMAQVFLVLKVRETGGTNKGEVVERFLRSQGGNPGDPWCVAFVAWIYETACKVLGVKKAFDANLSCSDLYTKAEKAGRIIDAAKAKTGDLFILRGGPTGWKHVGMVSQPLDDKGYLTTIEGNTNEQGSAEGDGVYKKRRKPSVGVAVDITPRDV